jgi:hypothetical protein
MAASAQVSTLLPATPTEMNDFDHHVVYTWRIDNISLSGLAVTGATTSSTTASHSR